MLNIGCRWLRKGHCQIGLGIHYGGVIGYGFGLYLGLVVVYVNYEGAR